MPASSRKRNKGKDRKAKKEESKRVTLYNTWKKWACGDMGRNRISIQCNHGVDTTIPDISHPISSFITEYFHCDAILDILQTHTEALDDSHRKLAIDILILIGANLVLSNMGDGAKFAFAIMVLEKYGESQARDFDATMRSRDVTKKAEHLTFTLSGIDHDRDVLKFFRKRITCKCLKKMHLEARKTQPKLALCEHCNQAKERRLLMVCSRCMVAPYCSRECQIAASPKHREHCDLRVKAEQILSGNP